jgi:hypothetical protein
MPPTDNTSSPTPGNPKKGFFAKLAENFFKKSPEKTTVAAPDISKHESQTPAPVLDDASDRSAPAGAPATDAAAPAAGTGVAPQVPTPAPTVGANEDPNTLNTPASVEAKPIDTEDGSVSPPLATQPPAGGPSATTPPEEPKEDSSPNPAS